MSPETPTSRDEASAEYWRWTESRWTSPDLDPKDAGTISAGVDVGSVSTQAVVMLDGELYCSANMRTGGSSPDSAARAMRWALEGTGLAIDDLHATVGTGYGRVNVPFATRAVTEIACHARGGHYMYGPALRTLLDMGGQDCKVIRCDEHGKVERFLLNEKCAAGTGRGMEVFADLLGVHINEVGELSLQVKEDPPPVAATCVVFARSEATALLREGWPKEKVLASYCSAMAQRVFELLERVGIEREFAVTGGIAKNVGIVRRLADKLGIVPLTTGMDTQLAGAIGAALIARKLYEKKLRKR